MKRSNGQKIQQWHTCDHWASLFMKNLMPPHLRILLGFFIDGVAGRVSPIPQKVSKVIAALRWFAEKAKDHRQVHREDHWSLCPISFLLRRETLVCLSKPLSICARFIPEEAETVEICCY